MHDHSNKQPVLVLNISKLEYFIETLSDFEFMIESKDSFENVWDAYYYVCLDFISLSLEEQDLVREDFKSACRLFLGFTNG